jgi:RNA polymerase subunit RPABC4/transcription elongation factor Spt4
MEEQFLGVSVKRASDIISKLLTLPVRDDIVKKQNPGWPDVPAGRYAVESDEGELRFYRLWVGNTGYKKLYLLHGPDSTELPYKTALGVCGKIFRAGIEECAIRYGREIGACSNCGRRLTNRISRELGIGPVCGGRMFGDDWNGRVIDARKDIELRGEDPDEEINDG